MTKVRTPIIVAVLFCIGAAAASAGSQPISWSLKDMKTAIRAIGYPRAHAKTLACTKSIVEGPGGQYSAFHCSATYPRHRHARFATEGVGEGGWICGAKTLAGCKPLRRGFMTTAQAATFPSLGSAADLASQGYLGVHDQSPAYRVHFCTPAGTSTWSCPYYTATNPHLTVTISFKKATGGYVVSGSMS